MHMYFNTRFYLAAITADGYPFTQILRFLNSLSPYTYQVFTCNQQFILNTHIVLEFSCPNPWSSSQVSASFPWSPALSDPSATFRRSIPRTSSPSLLNPRLSGSSISTVLFLTIITHHTFIPEESNDKLLAELEKAAEAVNGVFHIGYVNLEDASATSGLPSEQTTLFYGDEQDLPITCTQTNFVDIVKFIISNTKEIIQARSKYAKDLKQNQEFLKKEAERAAKESEEEAALRLKSDTIILDSKSFKQGLLLSRDPYLVNFYIANCSACQELNKEWEKVSFHYKGKLKVAKINMTENEDLEEALQLQNYPIIKFYPHGVKTLQSGSVFTGVKKERSIIDWAQKLNQQPADVQVVKLTADNYKSNCKTGKGTCVIIFLESDDNSMLSELSKLLSDYAKKPISFMYSVKGEQSALAEQFGIYSYPNVVMTYCFRKSFWRLDHFDTKKLEDAVGEVMLGNRNNFAKYKFEEKLV